MSPRRGATCTKRETRVKTWGVRAKISWNVTRNQRRTVFSADDHTRTHTFTRGNVPFFPFFFFRRWKRGWRGADKRELNIQARPGRVSTLPKKKMAYPVMRCWIELVAVPRWRKRICNFLRVSRIEGEEE